MIGEVVEQPLGGRRRPLSLPRVVGQRDIHIAQNPHVVVEPPQMGGASRAASDGDGEQRRETPGMFLERLDAEQFHAAVERMDLRL